MDDAVDVFIVINLEKRNVLTPTLGVRISSNGVLQFKCCSNDYRAAVNQGFCSGLINTSV